MVQIDEKAIKGIGEVLNDPNRPLKERFRALFTLKNIGGDLAIEYISKCFKDDSALLKHELAYCLGQMQDKRAIPILSQVLEDKNQEPMVRHEAGKRSNSTSTFSSPHNETGAEHASQFCHNPNCQNETIGSFFYGSNGKAMECITGHRLPGEFQYEDLQRKCQETHIRQTSLLTLGGFIGAGSTYHQVALCLSSCHREALGAIGDISVLELLQKYEKDSIVEVAETCELAVRRLKWLQEGKKVDENVPENPYLSVDPTPPSNLVDVDELGKILVDDKRSLFERYQAMFTLRNLGSEESIDALGKGLEAPSALFRHEVAFVFGQLQDPRSVKYLIKSLENDEENEMVRHEAAEALGSIATDECQEVLKRYLNDEKRVVRESCEVALDMSEYENSPEFQYANTLLEISSH